MAAVSLRGVSKRFGKVWAVRDVDLDIEDGEFAVFVGPSGCGKSTLLRLVAGLEDPTAGEILIDGALVNDRTPAERGIAMVFQSYALYPHMTVYDNMAFGLRQARYGRQGIADRIRRAAAILRIEELLQRKPRELSGGQRQRVAIGRAIVREPRVFLFDEPLSNLDAALRVDMRLELAKLHADLGATMIYVTHDQVEAMTLAGKIVVLNAGRVEQVGPPLALYHRPRNLFVAGFIGSPRMNFLAGRIVRVAPGAATVAFAGSAELTIPVAAEATVSVGAPVTLGIRPEHLVSQGGDAMLVGSLAAVERLGSETYLYLSLDDGSRLTMRVDADTRAGIGDRVAAGFPAAACHLFDRDGTALTGDGAVAGGPGHDRG